jgi:hypothetical protein
MAKYNSIDNIPAKVFFEILKTKNYQLLRPKPKEKGLDGIFLSIHEEWFKRSSNDNAKRFVTISNKVIYNEVKILLIKRVLKFVWDLPQHSMGFKAVSDIVVGLFETLEKELKISVNRDNVLLDEIERILQVEVGILENEVMFAKSELEQIEKESEGKIFDFYDSLVAISSVYPHGRTLDEKMTLAMYVAEEKAAVEISRKNKYKQVA